MGDDGDDVDRCRALLLLTICHPDSVLLQPHNLLVLQPRLDIMYDVNDVQKKHKKKKATTSNTDVTDEIDDGPENEAPVAAPTTVDVLTTKVQTMEIKTTPAWKK